MPVDTHGCNCQSLYGFHRRSCHGIVRSVQLYAGHKPFLSLLQFS
jgi:hypothetical protein